MAACSGGINGRVDGRVVLWWARLLSWCCSVPHELCSWVLLLLLGEGEGEGWAGELALLT